MYPHTKILVSIISNNRFITNNKIISNNLLNFCLWASVRMRKNVSSVSCLPPDIKSSHSSITTLRFPSRAKEFTLGI